MAPAAPMIMAPAPPSTVLPNPVFEGSEKRVEIDFNFTASTPDAGLRALSRDQLDELMSLAACTIVSQRRNEFLDAYVLSESSLFVYPTKWVLKTCGTTKLLNAVPRLLEMASGLGMESRRCMYSRASFLFPEQQPFPHTSFDHEARYLRSHFGHLGAGGAAYVLGDMFAGLQWHVYVADALGAAYAPPPGFAAPTHKLEVCMTDLARDAAARFYREQGGVVVTAPEVTLSSGIAALVPGADVDDYVFEPCGYSMNGILGGGFMTIHITPEEGFSYCSVELSGFDPATYDAAAMVARITRAFKPGHLSVSLSVDVASATGDYVWGTLASPPPGYGCQSATCQELAAGGRVSYYTLSALDAAAAAAAASGASALPAVAAEPTAAAADSPTKPAAPPAKPPTPPPPHPSGKAAARAAAPATLLRHMPSFSTCLSDLSDMDIQDFSSSGTGSGDEGHDNGSSGGRPAASARWAAMRRARTADGDAAAAAAGAAAGAGGRIKEVPTIVRAPSLAHVPSFGAP